MFKDTIISNHPTFNNITRKVEMIDLHYNKKVGTITMELKVNHFIGETAFTEYDKTIELVLRNKIKYPTGQLDIKGQPIMIGDFDLFVARAENGESFKDMVIDGIADVDSKKTIDIKCNYVDKINEE